MRPRRSGLDTHKSRSRGRQARREPVRQPPLRPCPSSALRAGNTPSIFGPRTQYEGPGHFVGGWVCAGRRAGNYLLVRVRAQVWAARWTGVLGCGVRAFVKAARDGWSAGFWVEAHRFALGSSVRSPTLNYFASCVCAFSRATLNYFASWSGFAILQYGR